MCTCKPLAPMVGVMALGAGKVKKTLSPALYDRVMALLSSMVKRAAPQITHLIVDASLRMEDRACRGGGIKGVHSSRMA